MPGANNLQAANLGAQAQLGGGGMAAMGVGNLAANNVKGRGGFPFEDHIAGLEGRKQQHVAAQQQAMQAAVKHGNEALGFVNQQKEAVIKAGQHRASAAVKDGPIAQAKQKANQPVPPPQMDPATGAVLNQAEIARVTAEKTQGAADVTRLEAEKQDLLTKADAELEKANEASRKSTEAFDKANKALDEETKAGNEIQNLDQQIGQARQQQQQQGAGQGQGGFGAGGAQQGGQVGNQQGGGQQGNGNSGIGGSGYLQAAKSVVTAIQQANQQVAIHHIARTAKWTSILSLAERGMAYIEAAILDQTLTGSPLHQAAIMLKTILATVQGESRGNMEQANKDGQEYNKEKKASGSLASSGGG